MKRFLAVLILLGLLVLTTGCTDSKEVAGGQGNESTSITIRGSATVTLYPGPQPEMLASLGEIQGGSRVEVLEQKGEWLHIKQAEMEGWIPQWYACEDTTDLIKEATLDPLVLKEDSKGRLYPEGPEIIDLPSGKLLSPLQEWKNWYYMSIMVYDIPSVHFAWIPKDQLVEINSKKPMEGYLWLGTDVYLVDSFDEIKETKPEPTTYEMNVFITEQKGEYIRVNANGGWTAWTEEKNLQFIKPKAYDPQKIMSLFFPNKMLTPENESYRDQEGKVYHISKMVPGTFIHSDQEEVLVVVEVLKGLSHAEGFYQAYVGILNEQEDKLFSEVRQFSADEGEIAVFKGNPLSFILFAGNSTFNGWTSWTGGLWKAGPQWQSLWPSNPDFWEHNAIEIEGDSLKVLERKTYPKKDQLIPDYEWKYAYDLKWDKNLNQFVKSK